MKQSIRKVQQCDGITLKNVRCRKKTSMTNLCWIHLGKKFNLRIKTSNISNGGKGLFAYKKTIPKNKKIANYTGRHLTSSQVIRKYGDGLAEYAICDKGKCVDANETTDGAPRYANDARGSRFKNNSFLLGKKYNYFLKSSKNIKPHQEIFTNYGKEYWKKK